MFQELMPLLAQRTLLLMVSRVGADQISINVIPQRVKSTDTDRNDALFTPLTINGTAKELDEALPAQLVEFVGAHLGLSSTLKSAKEQMDAAAKAAREAARKTPAARAPTSPAKPIPAPRTLRRKRRLARPPRILRHPNSSLDVYSPMRLLVNSNLPPSRMQQGGPV